MTLTIPEQHQLKVAEQTLRLNPAMVAVMGGPSVAEARRIVATLKPKA